MSEATQLERYRVEQYRQCAHSRQWQWFLVGHFDAPNTDEARKKARACVKERYCMMRAIPVGADLSPNGKETAHPQLPR